MHKVSETVSAVALDYADESQTRLVFYEFRRIDSQVHIAPLTTVLRTLLGWRITVFNAEINNRYSFLLSLCHIFID